MKLKYQLNLFAAAILLAVDLAITLAGVMTINQMAHELNSK